MEKSWIIFRTTILVPHRAVERKRFRTIIEKGRKSEANFSSHAHFNYIPLTNGPEEKEKRKRMGALIVTKGRVTLGRMKFKTSSHLSFPLSKKIFLLSRGFAREAASYGTLHRETISSDTKRTQCRSKRNELYLLLATFFFKENPENIHGERRDTGKRRKDPPRALSPSRYVACSTPYPSRLPRSSRYSEIPSRFSS